MSKNILRFLFQNDAEFFSFKKPTEPQDCGKTSNAGAILKTSVVWDSLRRMVP